MTEVDRDGVIDALNSIAADELMNAGNGMIAVHDGVYEGYDEKGHFLKHPFSERKMYPNNFGFNIAEGDFNGQDFIILVPARATA